MKYINEYRDKKLVYALSEEIKKVSKKAVRFMEVCGGHTVSIHKFGLKSLLPETITLLSGPGCPVCVSSQQYINKAIAYSRLEDVIITSFGDLLRVPGTSSTLAKEKAKGGDIRVVYSPIDALRIARLHPEKKVIFLGIGFETTAPCIAASIKQASIEGLANYFVYSTHKVMPPAMTAIITEGILIDGYICPGHVSAITGSSIYDLYPKKFKVGAVIAGFEPVDLLQSILMLVKQIENDNPMVEIQYKRAVKQKGNEKAMQLLNEIFTLRDDVWRGLGVLIKSGLGISKKYEKFDAEKMIQVTEEPSFENPGCICGDILKGLKTPNECPLFRKVCTPVNPIGACMVSNEGACGAYFKYAV